MSKLLVVARREYRETVRKKSFLLVTLLMPLLFGALLLVPRMLMSKSGSERRVLVLDGTGRLAGPLGAVMDELAERDRHNPAFAGARIHVEVRGVDDLDAAAREETAALQRGSEWGAVVSAPAGLLDAGEAATYFSRSATDLLVRERIQGALSRAVMRVRAGVLGLSDTDAGRLLERVELNAVQVTAAGQSQRGGEGEFLVVVVFAILLLMPTILHSQEILRGVIQEKTDRIVESLVSSMSTFDLLTGKVLGLAAVGLTQIAIWSLMSLLVSLGPASMGLAMGGARIADFVNPGKLLWFALFYLLGYLINACIFAAGGAAVNSEKEAQQILQPVMLVLMIPWFVIVNVITEPDGRVATVLSMLPVFCPVPMFVRVLVGSPPAWQIAVSIASAIASILGLFWVASRIFRVGILWYGKRPSLPEFIRWVRMP